MPSGANKTHQQMYKDWLNRAWRGGLRLMIMSAVNNEIIGKYHNNALQQTRLNLRDGPSIDRQIEAAYRFQDEIDTDYGCGNADNVRRTGPGGCGWYRIVTNPADARAVINAGKLAVVLGVEVDTLFDCGLGTSATRPDGSWPEYGGFSTQHPGTPNGGTAAGTCPDHVCKSNRPSCTNANGDWNDTVESALDALVEQGVRHIFPIHIVENGFGGPALYADGINISQERMNGEYFAEEKCQDFIPSGPERFQFNYQLSGDGIAPAWAFGLWLGLPGYTMPGWASTDPIANLPTVGSCNPHGLTGLGKTFVRKLMERQVLIDVDHMGNRSFADTVSVARPYGYPLVAGHTGLNSAAANYKGNSEFLLTDDELKDLISLGGLVSVGLRQQNVSTWTYTNNLRNECQASAQSWAQVYLRVVNKWRQQRVPTMGQPQASRVSPLEATGIHFSSSNYSVTGAAAQRMTCRTRTCATYARQATNSIVGAGPKRKCRLSPSPARRHPIST